MIRSVHEIRNDSEQGNLVKKIMIIEEGLAADVGGVHMITLTGNTCGPYQYFPGNYTMNPGDSNSFTRTVPALDEQLEVTQHTLDDACNLTP